MNAVRDLVLIFRRLYRAYGDQHWWPADTPLEVIVGAVLTQNTSWKNVERAIDNLKQARLMNLAALSRISPEDLAPVIRPAGFYNLKSRRLHALVAWLAGQGGFRRLRTQDTAALRSELLGLPGVGPETADSILLYALGRPVFVVDAYTRRILLRYGITGGKESYNELQAMFHSSLPPDLGLYNEYHALLVRLAKEHCRAVPTCTGCPLA